jgi:hypothetical protein
MKVPKASKGGFSGQMNHAAADIKAHNNGTAKADRRGIPTVKENVSNNLHGQPRGGKSACGMDNKMLNKLKPSKKGI